MRRLPSWHLRLRIREALRHPSGSRPPIIKGRDVIAKAQSDTKKTFMHLMLLLDLIFLEDSQVMSYQRTYEQGSSSVSLFL
ncbi:hypothetical protein Syun_000554 [Stephania yunnanensis]|uniref:Uncharacterized protein n=1 Tax=Stephania yunnanensis TaxID=152371 RepID=A0AAP0Q6W2_9MAGN